MMRFSLVPSSTELGYTTTSSSLVAQLCSKDLRSACKKGFKSGLTQDLHLTPRSVVKTQTRFQSLSLRILCRGTPCGLVALFWAARSTFPKCARVARTTQNTDHQSADTTQSSITECGLLYIIYLNHILRLNITQHQKRSQSIPALVRSSNDFDQAFSFKRSVFSFFQRNFDLHQPKVQLWKLAQKRSLVVIQSRLRLVCR